MFSLCVFVCMFVCVWLYLSRCLSGQFNYEGLVPHRQNFAGTLLVMCGCACYVSRTHDVINDVTSSQSKSYFKIDISPSIFELERRSMAQNQTPPCIIPLPPDYCVVARAVKISNAQKQPPDEELVL